MIKFDNNGKIKTSLLASFGAIIGLTILLSSFLIVMYSNIESKYRAISDSMILEYRITETFSQVVDSYASLLQDIDNTQYRTTYDTSSEALNDIFTKLNTIVIFPQSKEIFARIRNITISIKNDCDKNLSDLSKGVFSQGTGVYDRAIRGKDYVRENTANLILKELEYSKELQKKLLLLRTVTLISSFVLIALIVSGSTVFAIAYSNKLSGTVLKLANTAESISKGDLNLGVSTDLLERKDEIGSLSHSFDRMVQILRNKINELNASAVELERKNEKINQNNDELARMNKLMVGRELRMVELKKENDTLKIKIGAV